MESRKSTKKSTKVKKEIEKQMDIIKPVISKLANHTDGKLLSCFLYIHLLILVIDGTLTPSTLDHKNILKFLGSKKMNSSIKAKDNTKLMSKTFKVSRDKNKKKIKPNPMNAGIRNVHIPLQNDPFLSDTLSASFKKSAMTTAYRHNQSNKKYDFGNESSLIKIVRKTSDKDIPRIARTNYRGVESKIRSYITGNDRQTGVKGVYSPSHQEGILNIKNHQVRKLLSHYVTYIIERIGSVINVQIKFEEKHNKLVIPQKQVDDQGTEAIQNKKDLSLQDLESGYKSMDTYISGLESRGFAVLRYPDNHSTDPNPQYELYSIEDFYSERVINHYNSTEGK